MQRWCSAFALTCLFTVVLAGDVSAQVAIQVQARPAIAQVQIQPGVADRMTVMPGFNQNRLLQADAIFVGRVVALEPMDVESTQAPGQAKAMYRVAQVQVTEAIHGVKKGTQMVRVAFVAQGNVAPGAIGNNIQVLPAQGGGFQPVPAIGRRIYPGNIQLHLQVGQDGLFAVSKHHKENFFLSPSNINFVSRENKQQFDNELRTAKQVAKALDNPVAALKAEDKHDRYVAAAILITKYRSNPTGAPVKIEPIDAAESKLILQALQGGDWTPGRFNAAVPNPFELFNQLAITNKDGYNPTNIRNQQDQAAAMQKWLDENNGKYVIQKLVVDPNGKVQPVLPGAPVPPGIRPGIKVQPLPINKGKVGILPVPVPNPAPVNPPELQVDPLPPPAPAPIRRQ